MPFIVSGITRDRATGDPLGDCDVYLFKFTGGVPALVDSGVSDGGGAYSLDADDDDPAYMVVSFNEDADPDVAGVTARNLVPVEAPAAFPNNTMGSPEYFFFFAP